MNTNTFTKGIKILSNQRNIDINSKENITNISNNIFIIDGVNKSSLREENLIIYLENNNKIDTDYMEVIAKFEEYITYHPVIIFKNWDEERRIYWSQFNKLNKAICRKKFSTWEVLFIIFLF